MLRNLAVGDEACRQAVVDAGGPAAAVAAMGAHAANAEVQEQGIRMSKQTSYKHNHASSLYQTLAARARPTCKQKFTGRLQRDLAQGRMDHAHRSHETFDPAATGRWRHMIVFFPHIWGLSKQTKNCALQELCSARTV
jgi:hypothetical protein